MNTIILNKVDNFYKKHGKLDSPDKHKVRNIMVLARGYKILKKQDCEACGKKVGKNYEIHAHQKNYIKPLDIIWLCNKCHNLIHQNKPVESRFKP